MGPVPSADEARMGTSCCINLKDGHKLLHQPQGNCTAMLLCENCVFGFRDWSKEALRDLRQRMHQQLAASLPSNIQLLGIARLHARATQLEPVLRILAAPSQSAVDPASLHEQ